MIQITESNKYSTKDIAKWIRETLKSNFKDLKFSVQCSFYSGGSSISLTILESNKIRFIRKLNEITEREILSLMSGRNDSRDDVLRMIEQRQSSKSHQVNQYHIETDWQFTEKGKELIKQILAIANKYNWDRSDAMTDYFDVNYYLHFNLGSYDKPFIDGVEE